MINVPNSYGLDTTVATVYKVSQLNLAQAPEYLPGDFFSHIKDCYALWDCLTEFSLRDYFVLTTVLVPYSDVS